MTSNWPRVKLGEICNLTMGKTPSRSNPKFWDKEKATDNLWVSIADLPQQPMLQIDATKEHVSDSGAELFAPVPAGTLLMSFKLSIGRTAFAAKALRTNEAIIAFRDLNNELCSDRFLGYYLTHYDWTRETEGEEKVKGAALNKGKLLSFPIPLPPLEEQKRIVAKLDEALGTVEELKSNTAQALSELDALWQAILAEKFMLDLPLVKLEEIATPIRRGISPTYVEYSAVRVINQRCIRNSVVDFNLARYHDSVKKPVRDDLFLKSGDVLINSTGVGTVGRSAVVVEPDFQGLTLDSHVTVVRPNPSLLDTFFLQYYFGYIQRDIESLAEGSGGQVELSRVSVSLIDIPLPILEVQRKIVQTLNEIKFELDRQREILKAKELETERLRSSILTAAFNGEL